jgi:hypothetical protein
MIPLLEEHPEYFENGWIRQQSVFALLITENLVARYSLLPSSRNNRAPSTHPATTVLLPLSARGGLTGFRPSWALFMNCAFLRRISA